MNAKQIKVGQWYQTNKGDGKCIVIANAGRFVFLIDGKNEYLVAKDVQHEIAKGQEPQVDPQAPNEEQPWKDIWRHCPHCKKRTKIIEGEPPPEVCFHCGKDLIIHVQPKPFDMSKVVELQLLDYCAQLHGKMETLLYHYKTAEPLGVSSMVHDELKRDIDRIMNDARRLVKGAP